MASHADYVRARLESSIWLIPVGLCLAALLLGVAMLWVDRQMPTLLTLSGSLAMPLDTARQVLGVIAGSVISVGGVSFSVTMVALTLMSGQYGPKVLRHFLDDNQSKVSLGLFLGAYVYALVVLTGYDESDRPHLTVVVALLLTLFAVVGFIRFIHRTATDLQADEIVQRIGKRLEAALASVTSEDDGPKRSADLLAWRRRVRGRPVVTIHATRHGYVQSVDYAALVAWCAERDCGIQVRVRAGDFVVEGERLLRIHGLAGEPGTDDVDALNDHVLTGPVRSALQDPEYPITQLNQVAARALSPGINDPGTAITCIDAFSAALARVIDRDLPGCVFLDDDGNPRLLARLSHLEGILKSVFAPLRQFTGTHDVTVVVSLLEALCRLAELTARPDRLELLGLHGTLIRDASDSDHLAAYDRRDIAQRFERLRHLVERRSATP